MVSAARFERHQIGDNLIDVFLGDPIGNPGELRFLNRLRVDLTHRGLPARLTANFMAVGKQTRQIDLLALTDHRQTHVELKCVDPELPLVGGVNGPWSQLTGRPASSPSSDRSLHAVPALA